MGEGVSGRGSEGNEGRREGVSGRGSEWERE